MTIRFYLLLSFSVCGWNATAEAADRFVVSPKVGAPAGNLSPVLLIIRSGGGTYVGETENGQPVFELAAESELLTRGVRFNVPFEVTPLGNRRVVEMRELLVSWTPGKRPTPAELEEVGFRVVKTHDRGTFFVVQPTRPIPLSQESIRRLSILKKVEHAEFNHRMKVIPLPAAEPFAAPGALGAPPVNDPLYPRLWGLKRIDVEPAWANLDRTPPRVADSLFNADSEIIVAVIDSGVDYRHADLMQNMWVNKGEIPGNGIDDDNNGVIDDIHGASFIGATPSGDPMDENGHGTHCAGTIGAVGNNAFGLVGVNRRIKIMALKFLDSNGGGTTADAIQCIHYAIDNGATILSNSWGGGGATREMLEAIQETRRSRLIFVAAAGNATNNNDANPSYPASYPEANIVSVAAIAEDGSLASFSNYGATSVDIAAPGVNILSTYPRDNFKSLNGTSMATPHVAGAIALLWKHPRHRDLHWQEVLKRIYSNANTSPTLEGKVAGGRVLNIGFLGQTPNPDPPTTPVPDPPDPTPRPDPNP
ncbi:MAG: S8 family peptidase, partial [Planctomycetota bacterium]|nr:S8 family peptidase [Planctomycetota bacterium]